MPGARQPGPPRAVVPLLLLSAVVALVAAGLTRGVWPSNLHNGVLAFAFTFVGAYVVFHRPGHREGGLMLLVGAVEAVLFFGRQVGHSPSSPVPSSWETWMGWLGVWPTAVAIALTTCAILCFPEGHFLSRGWQRVGTLVLVVAGVCALLSALWPVEYAAAGVAVDPPFALPGTAVAEQAWTVLAHPMYGVCQVLWVIALVDRWRRSDQVTRGQLTAVLATAGLSLLVLVTGLALRGSPVPGLLSIGLIPVAAGFAIHRLSLTRVIEEERAVGHLDDLTARENQVLDLMARGLSNAAIAERLHLSQKTVEPLVGSIYRKLGLEAAGDSNRRVLAVVRYLHRSAQGDRVAGADFAHDEHGGRREHGGAAGS